MKILYLIKKEHDETLSAIMNVHRKDHEVTVMKLGGQTDYDNLVDLIVASDKIISW